MIHRSIDRPIDPSQPINYQRQGYLSEAEAEDLKHKIL